MGTSRIEASVDPKFTALAGATALVAMEACARGRAASEPDCRLADMTRPGTVVWTDPITGEERYARPGSRMYSTALMYAEWQINANGERVRFIED